MQGNVLVQLPQFCGLQTFQWNRDLEQNLTTQLQQTERMSFEVSPEWSYLANPKGRMCNSLHSYSLYVFSLGGGECQLMDPS